MLRSHSLVPADSFADRQFVVRVSGLTEVRLPHSSYVIVYGALERNCVLAQCFVFLIFCFLCFLMSGSSVGVHGEQIRLLASTAD